jgi:hypothetical protein
MPRNYVRYSKRYQLSFMTCFKIFFCVCCHPLRMGSWQKHLTSTSVTDVTDVNLICSQARGGAARRRGHISSQTSISTSDWRYRREVRGRWFCQRPKDGLFLDTLMYILLNTIHRITQEITTFHEWRTLLLHPKVDFPSSSCCKLRGWNKLSLKKRDNFSP